MSIVFLSCAVQSKWIIVFILVRQDHLNMHVKRPPLYMKKKPNLGFSLFLKLVTGIDFLTELKYFT